MKINKALVTGGAGFIGSRIVDALLKNGVETYVIDNLSSGMNNLDRYKDNNLLHLIIGDLRYIGQFLHKITDIDAVFHQAALKSVPQSILYPQLVHDVNVNMTFQLMNYCLDTGIDKFIFASSAAVYGELNESFASEDLLCKPTNPYGASKAIIETYLYTYWKTYGFDGTVLRYFNAYGGNKRTGDTSVIPLFIEKMMNGESPLIYGDGLQTRDFVNVEDIVQANLLAAESNKSSGEVFNVGSGISTGMLELSDILNEMLHVDVRPRLEPPRPGDVKFSRANIEKIRKILGYEPKVSLERGLEKMLEKEVSRDGTAILATQL